MSKHLKILLGLINVTLILIVIVGGISYGINMSQSPSTQNPTFTVTDMVQCNGNNCNAVLEMGDIAILVPFDSTKVHKGDIMYLKK